jgi:Tfp pilus assembly protein PilP
MSFSSPTTYAQSPAPRFSPQCLLIAAAVLFLWAASPLAAQDGGGMTLDVNVTTGSGSRTNAAGEVIEAVPVPAAVPDPGGSPQGALSEAEEQEVPEEERTVDAAMGAWQAKALADYNFVIAKLQDPFMPIQEVRGRPEETGDSQEDEERRRRLPPILRMELNQLKLVAITVLSDRPGGSLASFEDGAGASYILREGDAVGRNDGRIIRIEPNRVTVEEPSKQANQPPRMHEFRLKAVEAEAGLTFTDPEHAAAAESSN